MQTERCRRGAGDEQERGVEHGRGQVGRTTLNTHTEGNDSPGSVEQEDGPERGKKNRIPSPYEAKPNQNKGADSFLHPAPVGALYPVLLCEIRGGFIYSG